MANSNIGNVTPVSSILKTDYVYVTSGGSMRKILVSDFISSINAGNEQMLREVAWGVPIMDATQSSPAWGVIGNTSAWAEYKRMSGRYLVTNAGKAAKLSSTNSAVYADGTTLDETKGHVMFISPRLYYLVQNDSVSGIPYLWMSMLPISGHYVGEANGGTYNCIGAYKGSVQNSALVSRSGIAPDTAGRTINSYWSLAQVNGADWGITSYDQHKLMLMLGLSQYGNTNIQANLGYGVGGSSGMDLWTAASALLTGATKSLGDAFGNIPISLVNGSNTGVNCSRVNLMGIEDVYGWQWDFIQNIFCGSSGNSGQSGSEIFIYKGNRMPSSAELAAHPTGDYRQLTRNVNSGNIERIIAGEYFDYMPSVLGGDSNSYWCDYSWANSTGQVVLFGGTASDGAVAGLAYAHSYNVWSVAYAFIGARLAYYGQLTFVNGSEI
jgi:hypothetical protein